MIEKIQELLAQATGRDAADFADADENLLTPV